MLTPSSDHLMLASVANGRCGVGQHSSSHNPRNDRIDMETAEQEYYDLMSVEPEKNADMGIIVPTEKIKAWSLMIPAVRN
jgi:hypothetical protein